MKRISLPLICELLLFCIPLNIYCIGDYIATGIQWALFRFQISENGNSLILASRDLFYVTTGILKGSSAISTILWIAGTVLLIAALLLLVFSTILSDARPVRPAGYLTIVSGILFLCAMLAQYGLTLHNIHGYAIPFGIPVVIVTGIWCATGAATGRTDDASPPDPENGEKSPENPGPGE